MSNFVQMKKYFRWKFGRIISFFPHINKVIRPFLQKLSSKIYFFSPFWNHVKSAPWHQYLDYQKKWLYEFSCFFWFQVKYSIAIFSAIQNSIWTFFDESREFSKMFISAFFNDFFSTFFRFYAFKNHTKILLWFRLSMQKTCRFCRKCVIFIKNIWFFNLWDEFILIQNHHIWAHFFCRNSLILRRNLLLFYQKQVKMLNFWCYLPLIIVFWL